MITDTQIILRLMLSMILGGLVGFERQTHKRDAGLRTHILVCLGSCLIMLTSIYIFEVYKDQVPLDPGRIAAGVITGIGFLGAGTIIRGREEVKGLTTAASLWIVSAIGLSAGIGFYKASIFATLLVLIVLSVLRRIEVVVFPPEELKKNQGGR